MTEEASASPSPTRSAVNRNGTIIPEAEVESTISLPSAESVSPRDAPVESPPEGLYKAVSHKNALYV